MEKEINIDGAIYRLVEEEPALGTGVNLIKEAERKGFKEGVVVSDYGLHPSSHGCGSIINDNDYPAFEDGKLWFMTDCVLNLSVCVFDNGKWAKIIEEKKPLYINAYGTEFFDGDEIYWYDLPHGEMKHCNIKNIDKHLLSESRDTSEIMTERECHRWIDANWDKLKK